MKKLKIVVLCGLLTSSVLLRAEQATPTPKNPETQAAAESGAAEIFSNTKPVGADDVQRNETVINKDGIIDPEAAKNIGRFGEALGGENPPMQFSEAETTLWLTDQLKNISEPTKLKYEFVKTGAVEEGFTDTVEFHIKEVKADGMKAGEVHWFTGERSHPVPPYESTNGNPVIGVYLQGDVLEMNRLTEGYWRYFHRLIKQHLAAKAEVKTVEIDYNGKKVAGKQIKILPYLKDPRLQGNDKFKLLEQKEYLFTVSDDIPGYLYEIHTHVPALADAADKNLPYLTESIKFVGAEKL